MSSVSIKVKHLAVKRRLEMEKRGDWGECEVRRLVSGWTRRAGASFAVWHDDCLTTRANLPQALIIDNRNAIFTSDIPNYELFGLPKVFLLRETKHGNYARAFVVRLNCRNNLLRLAPLLHVHVLPSHGDYLAKTERCPRKERFRINFYFSGLLASENFQLTLMQQPSSELLVTIWWLHR